MLPINRVSVIDQVVDSLVASVTSGEFATGDKLPSELSLCETLSVSRSTIREALRVLQTMGYVELKRGRGAFVLDNEPHDFETIRNWFKASEAKVEEFAEARGALESLAIKKAIRRVTEKEIEELEKIDNDFRVAVKSHNVAELARLDEVFHSRLFSIAGNTLLTSLNNLIASEFKKYRIMSFSVKANAKSALEAHARILGAIKNRDEQDGVNQIRNHLDLVVTDMQAIIGDGG